MATTAQEYDVGVLSQLEARERELTRQLADTQAEIAALRARLGAISAPEEGRRIPLAPTAGDVLLPLHAAEPAPEAADGPGNKGRPFLMIQPLAPQDPLRTKWKLGSQLPSPDSAPQSSLPVSKGASAIRTTGTLRLLGLMDDGRPWERRIPFSDIARDGGITLGRDATLADIVVEESSVSRRHACLEITDEGLVVTDLGSTNGMRLDERLLSPYERQVPLHDGATLSLGEARLLIEIIP